MERVVFGEHEVQSLSAIIVDMVAAHMAEGHSEDEAIQLTSDEIRARNDEISDMVIERGVPAYVRKLWSEAGRRGPRVNDGTGFLRIRKRFSVPAAPKPEAADIIEEPLKQINMDLRDMSYREARLALANQERKVAAYQKKVDRLEFLIDEMERRFADAMTIGEAADLCGFTEEVIDLSDVLDQKMG
jgi:uncharacterized protein YoaH (UPF0181 family)